jgi:diguanylate cyclase (GGDEF)-like protein/PAS domain S-box-containing protein
VADLIAVTHDTVVDPAEVEAAFLAVLAEHPGSLVAAVNADGLFVPLPASFSIERARVLQGRTALDVVVPDDRLTVIDGWHRCQDTGMSVTKVRLAAAPDDPTELHLLDLTARHGTYFCVLIVPEGAELVRPDAVEGMASRVTWTRKNERAEITDADPGLVRVLGWTPDDMRGKGSVHFIHPDDQELAIDNWLTMLSSGTDGQRVRLRHLHDDGHYVWVEIVNQNHLDDPADPHVLAQMIDITEEMAAQEALREREQLLNRLAEALPSGLLHLHADRTIAYTNERLHEIVGVARSEDLESQLATVVRDDWPELDAAVDAVLAGADIDLEVQLRLPGADDLRRCHVNMRSLTEPDGTVNAAIVSVDDVTEAATLREQLRERATVDALTRCLNRAAVMQLLDDSIANGERLAVVFLDLDRFKAVNDELGHAAGDELLVAAATRLRNAIGPDDVAGRLGGDEFIVVLRNIASRGAAFDLAERLAMVMAREVVLEAGVVDLRASVGVAVVDEDVTSADDLVARADAAMYESKRRALGRAVPFSAALRQEHGSKLGDERALHHALDRGDLVVHFQPIVELASGTVVGHESLAHWTRGSDELSASAFIEMAEDTGLILELGRSLRAELLRTAVEVADRVAADTYWFCNLSTHELEMPGIVGSIVTSIDEWELDRARVVVEFRCDRGPVGTEAALHALAELRAAGLGLAVDDFGAGWVPLDVLRAAAPTWVKLAPSLTTSLASDALTASVVHSTLDLAARLGATPVAKGIETPAQRASLVELGVRIGQGHLFAAAAPIDELLSRP